MNDILKTKLKKFQAKSFLGFSGSIAMISVILFCLTQLAINASLNPQGIKLESFNTEKTALVEENRQLEEEIAEAKSISVISQIADKKLDLTEKDPSQIRYITDTGLVATAQ
jgi:cell division protein FtsL